MGGGSMRYAAKVAGFTAGGLRGNNPAARTASYLRPAATATKTQDVKLVASSNSEEGAGMMMPRVVFGGVPTMEEAREATSELSEALYKAYLSSPHSVGYEGSSLADHESNLALSSPHVVETKDRVTSEVAIPPAVPATAIRAFRLLHESSDIQNVVASIACDPNVLNSVLQNPDLQGYLQSQETYSDSLDQSSPKSVSSESQAQSEPVGGRFKGMFQKIKLSVVGMISYSNSDQSSPKSVGSESQAQSEPVGGRFKGMFQKTKLSVVEMMSGLSGFFGDYFGVQGGSKVSANSDGTAGLSTDAIMGKSFIGLAVIVILMIVLKRPYLWIRRS